jgi:hypothetical protein
MAKKQLTNCDVQILIDSSLSAHKSEIKSYVNSELRSESILNYLGTQLNIANTVEQKINNLVPTQVTKHAEKIMEKVDDKLKDNNKKFKGDIPGYVSRAMGEQMGNYLRDNETMKNILNSHAEVVHGQLSNEINTTMWGIINSDQYHVITRNYIESMNVKSEKALNEINFKAKTLADNIENQFVNKLNSYDAAVKEKLLIISNLEKKINAQEQLLGVIVKNCESLSFAVMMQSCFSLTALVIGVSGMVYYLKK